MGDIIEISTVEESKVRTDKKKLTRAERDKLIAEMTRKMKDAAKLLDFEQAAYYRDNIKQLNG